MSRSKRARQLERVHAVQVGESDVRATRMDSVVEAIQPVLDAIRVAGGRPLIVGGAVRDMMLGFTPKDVDVEVYGLAVGPLVEALSHVGRVHLVGQAFGVLKVDLSNGQEIDISVPRRDNKIGKGHRAFAVTLADLTPQEAAARRDFTMNSLAYDPFTDALIDPYGGVGDLKAGILRHTSLAFVEDPLRVLRAMQFAARFRMQLEPETAALCRSMLPEAATLPRERVFEEWRKWALKGAQPSAGLRVLLESGWIMLYPELAALVGCAQDPEWHPEGDAFAHTQHVCDAAAAIADRDGLPEDERLVLLFAALCHDLGKATTTQLVDGHLRSRGHAEAGGPLTASLLGRLGCWPSIADRVAPLVREHLTYLTLPLEPRALRRLAIRLEPASVEQWGRLIEADHSGRPPLPPTSPADAYVDLARRLAVEQGRPKPILLGRHLLAAGWQPGPAVGRVLRAAYEAQIEGAFDSVEGGLDWVTRDGAGEEGA